LLNELELIRYAPTLSTEFAYFDSGGTPGSYIAALWPGRQVLAAWQPLYQVQRWLRSRQARKGAH
jgi:hypothetical protein